MTRSHCKDGFYLDDDHHLMKVEDGQEFVYIAKLAAFIAAGPNTFPASVPLTPAQVEHFKEHQDNDYARFGW